MRFDRGVEVDVLAVGEALEARRASGRSISNWRLTSAKSSRLLAARGVELGGRVFVEPGLGEPAPGAPIARVLVVPLVVVVDDRGAGEVAELVRRARRERADRGLAGDGAGCRARRSASPGRSAAERPDDSSSSRRSAAPRSRSHRARACWRSTSGGIGAPSAGIRPAATRARRAAAPSAPARDAPRRGTAPARPKPRPLRRRRAAARRAFARAALAIGSGLRAGGGVRRGGRAIAPRDVVAGRRAEEREARPRPAPPWCRRRRRDRARRRSARAQDGERAATSASARGLRSRDPRSG